MVLIQKYSTDEKIQIIRIAAEYTASIASAIIKSGRAGKWNLTDNTKAIVDLLTDESVWGESDA